ncbi:MAG: damage-control phosphatase ARMT1 family protein [Dehalococcoidia bacterium]
MRISKECRGCLLKLADQASRLAAEDKTLRQSARKKAEQVLEEKLKPGSVSIVVASAMHDAVKKASGNPDPYRRMKDIEIETARRLFELVSRGYKEDFKEYLKLAALGNAIDFFRPIEEVRQEIQSNSLTFTIDDSALLEGKVKGSRNILYLADNAGEIYFDLPLLKLMRKYSRTVYVVKQDPVQNDITLDEIRRAGLEQEAGEVMTTGTATPGIDFSQASDDFKRAFEGADLVFAKGMGYYETLEELPAEGRIFFCLKAKCGPVARSLKVPLNSYVALLH